MSFTPSTTAWTGGQYSLYRVAFGTYLLVHFAQLLPWGPELFSSTGVLPEAQTSPLIGLFPNLFAIADSPAVVTAALGLGVVCAGLLAVGWRDRIAALVLWYLWACLFGRNPLISNPGLPYIGLLLVVHACLPRAPFGSLEARGRLDPGGGWAMPASFYRVVWFLMAAGYTYSGATKLVSPSWLDGSAVARVLGNPLARPGWLREFVTGLPDGVLRAMSYGSLALELAFLPLALFARTRPWVWSAMLAMHVGLIALIDFADLSLGMLVLHAFTFDPRWIRPRGGPGPDTVFYDGACGLCHRTVRLLLAEDEAGEAFRFAPLQGPTFAAAFPNSDERHRLPDSLIVRTSDGRTLLRSSGVVHLLRRLGGAWGLIGLALCALPVPLRDACYDGIARVRTRLFAKPAGACPMLPPALGRRFDA